MINSYYKYITIEIKRILNIFVDLGVDGQLRKNRFLNILLPVMGVIIHFLGVFYPERPKNKSEKNIDNCCAIGVIAWTGWKRKLPWPGGKNASIGSYNRNYSYRWAQAHRHLMKVPKVYSEVGS